MSLKITVEYNGERITVEKDGEVSFEDLMGALKSGLQAAKVQWKNKHGQDDRGVFFDTDH